MLRFQYLEIKNFVPYKGTQTIDFPSDDGVTIIWGDNGRGKTSLLNIFRFVLFGTFKNRQGEAVDLFDLLNREAYEEGDYDFGVTLGMQSDDAKYELIRQCSPRAGVEKPESSEDFTKQDFLKKDGAILSNDDMEHTLETIMPNEVSRFFLFDGELLEEYEELLLKQSDTGATIKESIERILGVPVLTNSRDDVQYVVGEYEAKRNKVAKSNDKTAKYASALETARVERDEHNKEIEKLKAELKRLEDEYKSLTDEANKNKRLRGLVENLSKLEKDIEQSESDKEKNLERICLQTEELWRSLIAPLCHDLVESLQEELQPLEEKQIAYNANLQYIDDIKRAVEERHCPVCDQDVDDEHIKKLLKAIDSHDSNLRGLTEAEEETFKEISARITVLKGLDLVSDKVGTLEFLESDLEDTTVKIDDLKSQRDECRVEIKDSGDIQDVQQKTNKLNKDLVSHHDQIENLKTSIEEEKKKLAEVESGIAASEAQLNKLSSEADLAHADKQLATCRDIHAIFTAGVTAYRDKLKSSVESDATKLFLQIRSDKDYVKLEINDNYGLSMIDKSGNVVSLRSAGYEHIVALSLIGALHKNAPLSGPIIMDTPFGRLDPTHKRNVTKALPEMSDQIILLVYTDEIDKEEARAELGNSLKKEYVLERRDANWTAIEPC